MTKAEQIRPIVPIEEWLTNPFYVGPEAEYIRPYVKKFIIEYNHSKNRDFICTGASRTGKTYGARMLLQRVFYEMSCYKNFPCLFGLSPSTVPKVYWISYTMSKAESTGLKGLIKMIDKVPYWQQPDLKRKPLESELIFPFLEVRSGSNVSHVVGEDMLGAILDEANVRKVAKGTEVEEAQKMFQEMRQRSVMTFSKNGIWGGFSGIISSSTTSSSFVAIEVDKAKKNKDKVIMEASVYEANPEQYSKETFPVFIGNGTIDPFIVDQADTTVKNLINESYGLTLDDFITNNQDLIENVPVSIRKFYEEDLSFSLANMSGKVQSGTNFFITNKNFIRNMWNKEERPCYKEIPHIGIYDNTSVTDIWNPDKALKNYHGENVYVHVDASQKHDYTGFSALYYDQEDHLIKTILTTSFFMNDEIPDNQIDQEKILQLTLYMRDNGVNFKFLSGDHYAKDFLIPQWKKIFGNDKADYCSVDTTPVAALTVLNFMKLKRYSIPYYKQLEYELSNLQYDRSTNKVDHPHNSNSNKPIYFKDCFDGLQGATYHIYTREHVQYEQMMIEKEVDKVEIPDDGFFSSINTVETEYDEDEVLKFQNDLYGEDSTYISIDEL